LDERVDGERDAGVRHVDDDVDLVDVDPLTRDVRADVRLVLVVGGDHLDLPALGQRDRNPRPPSAAMVEPARRDRRRGRT
jgi:hypothetical protein